MFLFIFSFSPSSLRLSFFFLIFSLSSSFLFPSYLSFLLKCFASLYCVPAHVRWNNPSNQLDLILSLSVEAAERVKCPPIVLYQARETVCVPPAKPLWSVFMYKEPTSCKKSSRTLLFRKTRKSTLVVAIQTSCLFEFTGP